VSGNAHGAADEHEIATEVSAPQCAIRLGSVKPAAVTVTWQGDVYPDDRVCAVVRVVR